MMKKQPDIKNVRFRTGLCILQYTPFRRAVGHEWSPPQLEKPICLS